MHIHVWKQIRNEDEKKGRWWCFPWIQRDFDITISLLFSLETTTKITPWSPGYTSEFRQLFTSGKKLPPIDQNTKDGVSPQLALTYALD